MFLYVLFPVIRYQVWLVWELILWDNLLVTETFLSRTSFLNVLSVYWRSDKLSQWNQNVWIDLFLFSPLITLSTMFYISIEYYVKV